MVLFSVLKMDDVLKFLVDTDEISTDRRDEVKRVLLQGAVTDEQLDQVEKVIVKL